MTRWTDNARFTIGDRKHEVFIEDDHYLVVEDCAADYYGNYLCRTIGDHHTFGEYHGICNDFVCALEKAANADALYPLNLYISAQAYDFYMNGDEDAAEILDHMFEDATGEELRYMDFKVLPCWDTDGNLLLPTD